MLRPLLRAPVERRPAQAPEQRERVRTPSGSEQLASQYEPKPLVEGSDLCLLPVHGRIRRGRIPNGGRAATGLAPVSGEGWP